jgi:serine/threonine protein kinase/WD40 repeat protein
VNDISSESDCFDEVAESFVQRLRLGERPALSEYTAKYPDLAERIHRLFPALVVMEKLGSIAGNSAGGGAPRSAGVCDGKIPCQLGEYRVLREVGRGGMGIVYEAVQESLGRHVALKVLPFHELLTPTHLERFRREARAAARLHHTNIVPVFGVGEHEGVHYYAMQFILGQGLDEVLREVRRLRHGTSARDTRSDRTLPNIAESVAGALISGQLSGSRLTESLGHPTPPAEKNATDASTSGRSIVAATSDADATTSMSAHLSSGTQARYFRGVAQIGLQVAGALEYAHEQGVLHRDIKPSNLLLDTAGRVWVTDFGLAKAEDNVELTSPGDIIGTVTYMAPERFQGDADSRSDVYGLGVTLYEMLTLRQAFEDKHRGRLIDRVTHDDPQRPSKIDPHIPRDLETIVLKAIAKEPARRYQTAAEMAEDLARFLGDRPIRSRRTAWWERGWRFCRRNPLVAGLAAVSGSLLFAVALISSVLAIRLDREATRARRAERHANERLFKSAHAQAQASRFSGRPGRRFASLDALKEAARVLPTLEGIDRDQQILDLRNEAIACLALADLRVAQEWEGYPAGSTCIAFDRSLGRYARGDASGAISIYNTGSAREILRLPGAGAAAGDIKFSPDGRFLAASYESAEARVWDLGSRKSALHVRKVATSCFDWSADGSRLAVGFRDGSIECYKSPFTQPERRLKGISAFILALQPDGTKTAVSNPNVHRVEIRNTLTGEKQGAFDHPDVVDALCFGPDGRYLATACRDSCIYLWDMDSYQLAARLKGHQLGAAALAFSHHGDLLASRSWDATLCLWSTMSPSLLLTLPGTALNPSFNPDDSLLAGIVHGATIRLLEVAPEREYRQLTILNVGAKPASGVALGGAGNGIWDADFSPDDRLLVSASADGVRLWDLVQGREIAKLTEGQHETARFRPGGLQLATWGDTNLHLWPIRAVVKSDRQERRAPELIIGPPQSLYEAVKQTTNRRAAWSGDGRLLAISNPGVSQLLVIDVDRRTILLRLEAQPTTGGMDLSRDGKWVAAGTSRRGWPAYVWNVRTGELAATLPAEETKVVFSADSHWLVTATPAEYRFWQVGSWKPGKRILRSVATRLGRIAFSNNGELVALTDSDRIVHLLDARSLTPLATLPAPDSQIITNLRFNAAGTLLAAATETDLVQLWDLRRIRERLTLLDLDWVESASDNLIRTAAEAGEPGESRAHPQPSFRHALPLAVSVLQGSLQRRWEAENLPVIDHVNCETMMQDMGAYDRSRWSRGQQLFAYHAAPGSYFTVRIDVVRAGNYDLGISFAKAPDYAEVQVSLDGKSIGQAFDGYDLDVVPSGKISFGSQTLDNGAHDLRFTIVGKNPKSGHYCVGVDCIDLKPVQRDDGE